MANYERYETEVSLLEEEYIFYSVGRQKIEKRVRFTRLIINSIDKIYNCAFGDWDSVNQKLNYANILNNGDRNKVLATVINTIFHYTEIYPDRIIYFEGSNTARTNLYGRIISQYFEILSKDFDIFGIKYEIIDGSENVIPYQYERAEKYNYDAFIIKRR